MDTWRGWLRIWHRLRVGRSLETRFQGQAVCIHDEPASDGEDRVKSEVVLAQQANVHDYFFYSTQVCADQHLDGPARGRLIASTFLGRRFGNDLFRCVVFD